MCQTRDASNAGKAMPDQKCGSTKIPCPAAKKITRVRVEFRPKDNWAGEFGFDWMRIGGSAEKSGEDVYKNVVSSGDGGLNAVAAYTAMKSEYITIPTEIKSPPENLEEYFVPYLDLFPKGTAGTPPPPFEVELKVLMTVEENPPDEIEFEYDKKLFTLDKDKLSDKAVGAKRVASDQTIKITCITPLTSDQDIKVWATIEGQRKLVGQLRVLKNDASAQKSLKFLFVNVTTNVNGTIRTGSISAAEKTMLRNALFQALIKGEMEDAPAAFDMSADSHLQIQTVAGTTTYGKFIYQKQATDGSNRTDGLYEDCPTSNFFAYVRSEFLKVPANKKYEHHFTIFAFDEVPYDVTTLGQVEANGVHNAALFAPTGGRKISTMAHEILHGLKLAHTHDSPGPNNKYIFQRGKTDNIMSYSVVRFSTWRRQWDVMKSGL